MTTFFFVRHGSTDWIGKGLAGDLPDVHINAEGHAQAVRLVRHLAGRRLGAIYSSPLERTRETAEPLARHLGLSIVSRPRLIEARVGPWSGSTLDRLSEDDRWRRYNSFRSSTRPAGGELMTDIASRLVDEMEELRERHP